MATNLYFHVASVEKDQTGNDQKNNEKGKRFKPTWGKNLRQSTDFHQARDGDSILTPFEYNLCIFRKLKLRGFDKTSLTDLLLAVHILRSNLDAFWSRTTNTVTAHTQKIKRSLKFSEEFGLLGTYESDGPYDYYDHCGYETACNILMYSRQPGRHSATYTQYETIRDFRTIYGNYVRASPKSNRNTTAFITDKEVYIRLVEDKYRSLCFSLFMSGLHFLMGYIWKPNRVMTIELYLEILMRVELLIEEVPQEEKHRWIVFIIYAVVTYVISLRGAKGFMLDLGALHRHWERNDGTYFIIPLLGKIKGEYVDRSHLVPYSNYIRSNINMKRVVKQLINLKESVGIVEGPAISDSTKNIYLHWRSIK